MALSGLHSIHISVPDSDATSAFLTDFGLFPEGQSNERQYFRSSGAARYSVVLETSEQPRLVAISLETDSEDDLIRAAEELGATAPRPLNGPASGSYVSLTDPDGNTVNLVHNVQKREPDELARPNVEINFGNNKPRRGVAQNFSATGPPQLLRMGHVGLFVRDMAAADRWYREVLGLLPSDRFFAGKPDNYIAGFYRIDRGEDWVDHHTIALFGFGKSDLHHVSFEVQDFEAQFKAHRWLRQRQHESVWGVGRHPKGCHIFDIWREPSGYRFETFSDTDLYTSEHEPGCYPIDEQEIDMWRDRSHESYFA